MRIMVIGLGYVGAVAAAGLAKGGHQVTAVDIDREKVESFRSVGPPNREPGLRELTAESVRAGRLEFRHVSEIDSIAHDAVMVCVGTPTESDGAVDLSQIKSAVQWVILKAPSPLTIIMKSTVPPGTGEMIVGQYLSKAAVKHRYVMNPEFLSEGRAVKDWSQPDRIVIGGSDPEAIEQTRSLYEGIDAPLVITHITTAEIIKYAANAFLATKISFINEIARLCDRLGADIDRVSEGIGLDKRIGPSFLHAGLGYGGSCFPKDTRALDAICSTEGINFELLRAVIDVNNRQRELAVRKLQDIIGSLAGKTIAVLGLSFKPGTDDVREAPSLDIVRALCRKGAVIKTYCPAGMPNARTQLPSEVELCNSALEALEGAHGAILATEWDEFMKLDWCSARKLMKEPYALVDGRNCLSPTLLREMGFNYAGFGRR